MKEKIFTVLRENSWVFAAVIFFIVWKFFLISILWQDRLIPPEPDDTLTYVTQIESVFKCDNFLFCSDSRVTLGDSSGFVYLSYRLFWGTLEKILGISPEKMLLWSFYIGTLFIPLVFIPFLKIFSNKRSLIALSVFFLTFYHGLGETHGFFWVVPSFFSALLFFVIAVLMLKDNTWLRFSVAIPLAILYTFMHPIGVYLIFIFPLYLLIHFAFTREFDPLVWKKMALIVMTVSLCSISQTYYLSKNSQNDSYAPSTSLTQAKSIFDDVVSKKIQERKPDSYTIASVANKESDNFLNQKISSLHAGYFRWIFPHWLAIAPFTLSISMLVLKRKYNLLSLYFASLIFFIIATFLNEFGFRSAIILWPVTYIVYAFSCWYFFEYALRISHPLLRYFFLSLLSLALFIFILLNALFAITINSNINVQKNFTLNPALIDYLIENLSPNQTISIPSVIARSSGGHRILARNKNVPPDANPYYIVSISTPENSVTPHQFQFLSIVKTITERLHLPSPKNITTSPIETLDGYMLKQDSHGLLIYQRIE